MPEITRSKLQAADFLKAKDLKKILELGKVRGVLTFEEVNDLIPADVQDAPRIDAVMDFLGDNDIEVDEVAKPKATEAEEAEAEDEGVELDEFLKRKQREEEASVRSIDPVKLYLRKMGSVSLLTREGEVEIAKRIEQGEEQIVSALLSCQLGVDSILGLSQKVADGQIRVKDMIRGVDEEISEEAENRKGKQIQGADGKKDVGFERRFFSELLKQPSWIAALRERQGNDSVLPLIENPDFRLVLEKILEPLAPGQSEEEHVEEALEALRDQPRLRGLFAESTLRWDDELLSADLDGALARLREDGLKRKATALQREIEEAEQAGDGARSEALLVQLMELRRQREQR